MDNEQVARIVLKYQNEPDHLRWAMKPVWLLYLLEKADSVIYLDNDIFFFNSYHFLFEQLKDHSLLLTPHWFVFDPNEYEENFSMNFQIGMFNAGFIGVSRKAAPILKWWTEVCLYKMSRDIANGFFDDQRYLDLAPIIDKNVGIVRHLGCNIGSWNGHQNKRKLVDGEVLIEGTYPVIFIHFNGETIRHITNGNDHLLKSYYREYVEAFSRTGFELARFKGGYIDYHERAYLVRFKRKLRLRTRLKKAVLYLYHKL